MGLADLMGRGPSDVKTFLGYESSGGRVDGIC